MHGEPSTRDDSELLGLWAREHRQEAFQELVTTYGRLVYGTALRRTGDAETARDVAQQVFATLASKARWLLGRQNLAGWLHFAASNVGARAARAESRRRAAMERYKNCASVSKTPHTPWNLVEEAVAALPETEREAIVLHYFQDLSYPEMAALIGIAEPAARKRVSRALATLERGLAKRGVRGAAAALLAGAVAQQAAMAAPAMAAAVSTGGAGASWTLAFSIMSKHTSVKLAATIAAVLVLPLAFQWNSNASARDELAALRASPKPAQFESSDELSSLEAALTAKREAIAAAERRTNELRDFKRRMESEVVVSLGTLDNMARKVAETARLMEEMSVRQHQEVQRREQENAATAPRQIIGPPPTAEEVAETEEDNKLLAELLPRAFAILREIPRLENSPEKAGRFYASLVADVEGLDEKLRASIEQRATTWVRELQTSSLAFPQRPKGDERVEWDIRRGEAVSEFLSQIEKDAPGGKFRIFRPSAFIFSPTGEPSPFEMIFGGGPR